MNPPHPRRTQGLVALAASLLLTACATTAPPTGNGRTPDTESTTTTPATPLPEAVSAPSAPAQPPAAEAAGMPVDPLRPEVQIDIDDAASRADLWVRVRNGFAMPDLDNELVRKHEQWYASRPDYVERMTSRGGRYLFHIVEELQKRGMPAELALLPFIESAFNPKAMSVAKASGMWQFMPATGRDFELRQNMFRDDRRDVLASTRAALDYLQRLHNMFGDWHLALAAYNWGEGSVQRAIARNEKAGLPTDYLSLRMPDETRNYVPKLQAVKNIVSRPADFALTLPPLQNHPYFLSVPIERDMDVALAAKLAGMSASDFADLNPQMNKPVILASGTPQILLPYDNANAFLHNLRRHEGALASWTAWVVPRTMKPADAAQQVGMGESELREINRIPPRMLVKAGSTLLVPRSPQRQSDVPVHVADNAAMLLAPDVPPLRRVALKAGKKGETVASIARRYRVSPAQVAQWNDVGSGARFKAGSQIVVFVPNAVATTRTASAAKTVKPSQKAIAAVVTKASKAPVKRVAKASPPVRSKAAKSTRVAGTGGSKSTDRSGLRVAEGPGSVRR
ncbi:transglycosylase SLT domain-containing protein [Aquincola tertiaricarbonis]|uniref:transglycosylase SLT domain-containing protein n=1 Tax=Aquincola tertiaricarbonis TaxID=391953 RepID=UPI000614C8F7|nr:transglycosylase SLT domain-containing protein [Aquincola tertiaricarbonis]